MGVAMSDESSVNESNEPFEAPAPVEPNESDANEGDAATAEGVNDEDNE
jgi:hypothetical protein